MSNIKKITEAIKSQGILPLYFNADADVSKEILKAVYRAGIRAIEYTNRGEAAFNNFKQLIALRDSEMHDMLLGIGTIKDLQTAQAYADAKADFMVSPGWVSEVAVFCNAKDIFYAPGCMTPTEIIAAENGGIGFIKLFPGNMLGPEFLTSIKEIFPKLLFMPTGGVDTTKESIESWFKAGVCAVGMGSKLISKKLMETKDYTAIENETRKVMAILQEIKG